MQILTWAFRILLFLLFFGFAMLNTGKVTVDYLVGQWTAPLALILLLFFVVGALFGVLVLVPVVVRHRKELRHARETPVPPAASAPAEPPRLG